MSDVTRVLVTGATGKVGQTFLKRFCAEERFAGAKARALCHNREIETSDRLDMVKGSISDRSVVEAAMDGVSHVVHLATCKETPDDVMDVTVKGMFWLLETARQSPAFKRFVLIGTFLLSAPRARHRIAKALGLPRLLRALQSARRGHARAVLHSVRPRRLLLDGALDHGKG